MKLVIDTCSIILLAKATVLQGFAEWKELMITKGVYDEVMEGKSKQLLDALVLERLVEEKKIIIKEDTKKEVAQKLITDFGLGLGEAESIAAALETKEKMIVTDNKQGRKTAKVQELKLVGSIDVVMALYKTKRIGKEKAIGALKILKEKGWFQEYILQDALEEMQNEKT